MQTAIKVEQLSKSYGNLLAIDQISLSVKYGTVYGLLGANGAGKSTTVYDTLKLPEKSVKNP